jgi:hypothetical protein
MKPLTLEYHGWLVSLKIRKFAAMRGGDRIDMVDAEDGSPVATCNYHVPGLAPNELAIKETMEDGSMYACLKAAGIIGPVHRYYQSGYLQIAVCEYHPEIAKQYGVHQGDTQT